MGMMKNQVFHIRADRRQILRSFLLGAGGLWVPGVFAEALTLTPRATEGPYYPDHLPLDQDNDLVQVTGKEAAALGTVTSFGGRLLNADGKAIRGATIELWQADNNGCYLHSKGVQRGKERDPLFQGFGKMETNAKGEYRFRTIMPGLYTGRTRHWHVAVVKDGKRLLTTQLFVEGEPQNERDGILKRMGTEEQRLSVIRRYEKVRGSDGSLQGTWDIVLGSTAEEPKEERRGPPPGERPLQ
jgi:protocatechuate 3,4-dioxygenase beta subunit